MMGGCGMNKEDFLILLELCIVYFAFQYAAVFDPAAGFQACRQLVFAVQGSYGYFFLLSLKPSFPKTGQKLVFLHKKVTKKNYETR